MGEIKKLTTPLTEEAIQDLHAGDSVMLSGVIYTARDKAHKLLTETLAAGKELPVESVDLLCGTGAGQTGSTYRFLRSYHQQPYG